VHSVISVAKHLFWLWLIALLVLNVIPLSNEANQSLSGNKIVFRLDYLVHMISFLAFAWVCLIGQVTKRPVFRKAEVWKYAVVVILAACGFELVQKLLQYRAFNPVDLMFNMIGGMVGSEFVWVSHRFHRLHR